jgi:uncharacterized membrane protein YedE/YeeE
MATDLIERWGEPTLLATGGLVIGLAFGLLAQRSRFCFRAAAIEVGRGRLGEKLAVWMLGLATAVIGVQALALAGGLEVASVRQIAAQASVSGLLVGGLLFGAGMVLTRGCPARLIVLTANGNLRALLSGLVFALAVQASITGWLAPLRTAISSWWRIDPGPSRSLLSAVGLGHGAGLAIGLALLVLAVALMTGQRERQTRAWGWVGGIGVGLTVTAAWAFSQAMARASFEPLQVHGLNFSAPSAEWLMRVLQSPAPKIGFEFGLIPGTLAGALVGGLLGRELRLEGFHDGASMLRYLAGAVLMGLGAVLCVGCAVGALVTGGALFALTAWLTLGSMALGAIVTDRLID